MTPAEAASGQHGADIIPPTGSGRPAGRPAETIRDQQRPAKTSSSRGQQPPAGTRSGQTVPGVPEEGVTLAQLPPSASPRRYRSLLVSAGERSRRARVGAAHISLVAEDG